MTDLEPPPLEDSSHTVPIVPTIENESPEAVASAPALEPDEPSPEVMFMSAKQDHDPIVELNGPGSSEDELKSFSFEGQPAQLPVSELREVSIDIEKEKKTSANRDSGDYNFQTLAAGLSVEPEEIKGDYDITITVSDPDKVGDGMGAFMVYQITCTTSIPTFKAAECTVRRRFSDFLKLHAELCEKHECKGRIVPPAPEKSMQNLTKVKMSKAENTGSSEFIEKRRAALSRYLNRIAKHPILVQDPIFRQFLENPGDLPYAKDMSYMSGAGIMRAMKNVGAQLSKMTTKMTETDMWFEMKLTQIEALDSHLRKLLTSVEIMVNERRILCNAGGSLASNLALLSQTEDNNAVAGAISHLSDLEGKVHDLNEKQWHCDYFLLGEMARDYIAIIASIKSCFDLRVKIYQTWQMSQNTLVKKREQEVKLQSQGKHDKVPQVQAEIGVLEQRVQEGQDSFDAISKNFRTEVERFEKNRAIEFKQTILKYLREMLEHQEKMLSCWQEFLPEAQNI
ncbi:Sorting nexin-2 [Oopsacas minuta]|uniref:Sorting nexin-2 n=1 Tax=Oopsacas minuta TaxID=111878 RepID=A0AAV7K258_9METZ|nr:Sorting nexin-2 [Oopsacas minuta]